MHFNWCLYKYLPMWNAVCIHLYDKSFPKKIIALSKTTVENVLYKEECRKGFKGM